MSECELVCIPPEHVAAVWPRVRGLIATAMRRGDFSAFAPVEESVLQRRAMLWLAVSREYGRERPGGSGVAIKAAAVTELTRSETRNLCIIVACGGHEMHTWLELLEPIEAFAKLEGCDAMRIIGREGWARILPGYRRSRAVIMEKELN